MVVVVGLFKATAFVCARPCFNLSFFLVMLSRAKLNGAPVVANILL